MKFLRSKTFPASLIAIAIIGGVVVLMAGLPTPLLAAVCAPTLFAGAVMISG